MDQDQRDRESNGESEQDKSSPEPKRLKLDPDPASFSQAECPTNEGQGQNKLEVKSENSGEGEGEGYANPRKNFCEECSIGFDSSTKFKRHGFQVHGCNPYNRENKSNDDIKPKPIRPCPVCKQMFPTGREMENHKRQEHGLKCGTCGNSFLKQQGLHAHMLNAHGEKSSYKCSFCGKDFEQERDLTQHLKTLHGNEPGAQQRCKVCNFATFSQFIYEEHVAKHKPSICNVCGLEFETKTSLKKHRDRTGHKP